MKIILINLAIDSRTIGLLNVATYLRAHGYKNTLIYYNIPHGVSQISQENIDALLSSIERLSPDIVGFSLTTVYFHIARQLTLGLKERLPSIITVWGGIHPTVAPQESLEHCDAACLAEGEEAFVDFIRNVDQKRDYHLTQSFWVNYRNTIYKNEIRPLCADLDSRPFPSPDWENSFLFDGTSLIPLSPQVLAAHSHIKGGMYDIMASRGCPFSCTYCCNSAFKRIYHGKGKILRFRSVQHVIAELTYALNTYPEIKIFNFQDDAFGAASEDYIQAFCDAYRREVHRSFHVRIIPTMINEKKIALLKEAGLMSAVMGLQSSDRMNKEIYHRPTDQKIFVNTAKMLHSNGIAGRYDVIIDNPYSTQEDEIEVINTFVDIPKPYHLYIYSLAFFPFTELTEKAIRDGTYNPTASGYDHAYGNSDQHQFPILAQILEMTPFMPRWLIRWFLSIKDKKTGHTCIFFFYTYVFTIQRLIITCIMKDSRRMLLVKKISFTLLNLKRKLVGDHRYS